MLIWITDPPNIIVPGSVQNGPFGPSTYSLGNGLTAVNTYDTLDGTDGDRRDVHHNNVTAIIT
jgi:hypothetical protein